MKLFLFFLISASAWAQIERPSLGVMLDENGLVRPVTGAPAAAALGDPLFGGAVISLACSQTTCLAKTETAVVSSAGETADAPPGAAIIAFIGDIAYVYFVETRQFAIWFRGQLYPFDFAAGGDVLSIRANGFAYAVARDDGIWVGNQNLGRPTRFSCSTTAAHCWRLTAKCACCGPTARRSISQCPEPAGSCA